MHELSMNPIESKHKENKKTIWNSKYVEDIWMFTSQKHIQIFFLSEKKLLYFHERERKNIFIYTLKKCEKA